MAIREFDRADADVVIALWADAGFRMGPSETPDGIAAKLERDPDLFLVAEVDGRVVGAVLGAFDGRRGWIYHLAVDPGHQRQGVGSRLLAEVERRLVAKGCRKVNLHVARSNADVVGFYDRQGYESDDLIFMSKWLPPAETH